MQVLAQFSSWSPASHKQSQESKDRSLPMGCAVGPGHIEARTG